MPRWVWVGGGAGVLLPRFAGRTESGLKSPRSPAASQRAAQWTAPGKARDLPTTSLVNRGTAALDRGDVAEALAFYEEALGIAPNDEDIHYNLGQAYRQQGRIPEARVEFQKVLRSRPEFQPARQGLQRAEEPLPSAQKPAP
jgi:tetratricopeptide (TPR) repeat protein